MPSDDAHEVMARAEAANVSYSEYIAALVHVGLQHPNELADKYQAAPTLGVLPDAS